MQALVRAGAAEHCGASVYDLLCMSGSEPPLVCSSSSASSRRSRSGSVDSDSDSDNTVFDDFCSYSSKRGVAKPRSDLVQAAGSAGPEAHAFVASRTKVSFFQQHSLNPDISMNLDKLNTNAGAVGRSRAVVLEYWSQRAAALESERQRRRDLLPEAARPIVGRLHLPLIEEMLKAARHKDETLMKHLEHGFPVSGEIDAGGAGLPDPSGRLAHGKPAHGTCPVLADLRQRCGSVNQRTLASARPGPHAEAVWAKHKQEKMKSMIMRPCGNASGTTPKTT